jgi:hypothetical protein
MNDAEFWNLIGCIDTTSLDSGQEKAAVDPLQTALAEKSETELVSFSEALAQKLFAIDGEAYAKNAGDSGLSADGFLYARPYVIAKGRDYYEAVRSQPEAMPKSIKQWCEALLYAHKYAWNDLTGRPASDWPYSPSVSYETGSNKELWA